MPHSGLTLLADNASLADNLQAYLKLQLGNTAVHCPLNALLDRLSQDVPELFLLLIDPENDNVEDIVADLRDLPAHRLMSLVVVVHGDTGSLARRLAREELHPAHRFSWPFEASLLLDVIRSRSGWAAGESADNESLVDVIGQRLLAQTPSLRIMAEPLALTATHDMTVLLTGETGTGKTYLARLIHEFSPRKNNRLLMVPCGALTANLVESEFFGHVKGAFTGADQAKEGKFAAAGNGTLLLDEIDALGLEQQANLLRVIETGEYEPVGSNKTMRCTARIIAASNINLEEAVNAAKFRQDLYYRLNVMNFYLPPLRDRRQDIAPLARSIVSRYANKFHKPIFAVSAEAFAALEAFPWPGNIRQLDNVLQQAVLVCPGPELLVAHLPPSVQCPPSRINGSEPTASPNGSLIQNREQVERNTIQRALASCDYSRAKAANALGISRVTLYKKMKKYGLMDVPLSSSNAL